MKSFIRKHKYIKSLSSSSSSGIISRIPSAEAHEIVRELSSVLSPSSPCCTSQPFICHYVVLCSRKFQNLFMARINSFWLFHDHIIAIGHSLHHCLCNQQMVVIVMIVVVMHHPIVMVILEFFNYDIQSLSSHMSHRSSQHRSS